MGIDELKSLRDRLNIYDEDFNEKKKRFKAEIDLEEQRRKIDDIIKAGPAEKRESLSKIDNPLVKDIMKRESKAIDI